MRSADFLNQAGRLWMQHAKTEFAMRQHHIRGRGPDHPSMQLLETRRRKLAASIDQLLSQFEERETVPGRVFEEKQLKRV
jgi:hypothetical protein